MVRYVRVILGAFLLAMGINKFIPFLPMADMAPAADNFLSALVATGYMLRMVGIVEIFSGAFFLFPATAPFAALILAPLSVNVVLFHLFLDPSNILMGAIVFLLNVGFGVYYFDYYRSIFAKILEEHVVVQDKKARTGTMTVATVN